MCLITPAIIAQINKIKILIVFANLSLYFHTINNEGIVNKKTINLVAFKNVVDNGIFAPDDIIVKVGEVSVITCYAMKLKYTKI